MMVLRRATAQRVVLFEVTREEQKRTEISGKVGEEG